ncbi:MULTISPECIES: secondary thiamine-phosphate synthase enzyme YjbQ [unclassified Haladaptatus]|uniref:secondary thiamine-phosphate synthase enzyme YjbQ n=1 Tax=unclassified Haladaptatus TaxID=2622732 RepID=UPI00209BFD09|nr:MULTISPECIES: secondary thiamine-phosphate synthase enzyme YjbQ [unclassified Haladaptatus]MCO8246614.1 secondary thiamine-phosphate synthase enzyme YjbQ [Haladaptatus sp. AB643]MCO8256262.1 secondary thiamine-phosphate synthase enzyme YjbQ [Haladaptatus sp. AB618]
MEFEVTTSKHVDIIDITDRVAEHAENTETTCTVFVPHTTAGVVVNENERRLRSDFKTLLSRLVPRGDDYSHDQLDGNADAHLRSMLLGEHVTVPVEDGELLLGTWQSILFVDCDGPRTRRIVVR